MVCACACGVRVFLCGVVRVWLVCVCGVVYVYVCVLFVLFEVVWGGCACGVVCVCNVCGMVFV